MEDRLLAKAKDYAYRVVTYRSKTKKELADKLKLKKYDEPIIKQVINEFEALGLLNDERYAFNFTSDKVNFNSAGKMLVKRQLLKKGVNKEIIDNTIEKVYEKVDEIKAATELAERRLKLYRKAEPMVKARRLQGFLARRGYGYDIINKVIKKLINYRIKGTEEDDDNE